MATHSEVRDYLKTHYQQLASEQSAVVDTSESHWRDVLNLVANFDDLKVASRQAVMSAIKAAHSCTNAHCPLATWDDEV